MADPLSLSRNSTQDMHDSMVTKEMYEAGLAYLNRRGTAWCVSDLYKAMHAAKVRNEIAAPINHEMEPHCIGCWVIGYDKDGLNAVCNECGETRDLIAMLAAPSEKAEHGWEPAANIDQLPAFTSFVEWIGDQATVYTFDHDGKCFRYKLPNLAAYRQKGHDE